MNENPSQNRELALSLAARGWYIFPCREQPGKPYTTKSGQTITPAVKSPYWDKNDLPHGKDDSTVESEKIRRWWGRWPGALVGIYCEKSGIWALDVDCKNGVDGRASLGALVEQNGGALEVGALQATPTGGMHLIFTFPQEKQIPNNAGKLGAGLDLRSDGYICSGKLPDGRGYTWVNPENWNAIPTPGEPVPAPAWLVELARKTDRTNPAAAGENQIQPGTDAGAYWLNHYLQGAVNGNRNDNGFALACQLRDSGLSEAEAAGVMRDYARRVPGAGYAEAEALASLEQAYQSPRREPARLPGIVSPGATPTTPPAEQAARFRILTAADALKPQPPVSWLVDKLFSVGSLNIVFGLPGAKKTWALLDMAVSLAAGESWLGMKTQSAPALVVDEESGERRLLRRLGEILRGRGCAQDLPVYAVSLAGFNLRDSSEISQLHTLILQTGARVVMIDALADIMPGADENAVKDIQPVMLTLRKVADKTQAAIILIHHANKTGMQYRGSTALPGAVDCMVQVTSETGAGRIDFDVVKSRDGEPFQFAALASWGEGTFTLSQAGEKAAQLPQSQRAILEQIADAGGSVNASHVADRKAIYPLRDKGYIYRSDTGGQGAPASYTLTDKGRDYLDANPL